MTATSPVLSLRGVSKRFGAVQALAGVSLECVAGEIHALVGENGSGKSTLLGIASGVLAPDEGEIEVTGRLATAYQATSHVLDLSVAENLYLAAPEAERPAYGAMAGWARETLSQYEMEVPVDARIGGLSLAERQFLEIVKALLSRPRVLLLDEPTTALGPGEVERLHELVVARAAEGVGVVYVSHRLPEVLTIATRVTVL